ncbi:MAG: endonuclease [Verrucomicrobia bacterium RIFCSPLOWO2_12_FULL_64_8]|nr:MAG: endonuclease [Verrucomicrobia bacterium RIFCSPLOWO2_12_FULL_64_8]
MCAFRVLQFNMQFGQIWDDAYPDHAPVRLDLTVAEILSHNADIVLLQEVERANPGGEQTEPPPNYTALRAALTGFDSYFSYPRADPRELPFGIGLAIFSKTPLRGGNRCDIPSPPVEFDFFGEKKTPTDRLLINAETTIDGHDLQIFNTHLLAFFMLKSSSEVHNSQRELIAQRLRASTGPTLLGGDFNVSKHHSLVRQFNGVGYRSVQTKEITWRRRPYVLDHVFYNRHLRPVRHMVKSTPASDHHVLVADFEFADPKKGRSANPLSSESQPGLHA